MNVEGLVPDARRPGSTRVLVNGRPAWTVPADVIASLALTVGSPLRGEVVERLDRAAEEEGAFRAALRALERRAHGERELAIKLERKGHTAAGDRTAAIDLPASARTPRRSRFRAVVHRQQERRRGRGPLRLRRDLGRTRCAARHRRPGARRPHGRRRRSALARPRAHHWLPSGQSSWRRCRRRLGAAG